VQKNFLIKYVIILWLKNLYFLCFFEFFFLEKPPFAKVIFAESFKKGQFRKKSLAKGLTSIVEA